MIPLAKILELRKKRSAAVACDAADDTECTKDDPSTCRIHGKKALAETDAEDKSKHSHVNPYGGKPMSVQEAEGVVKDFSQSLICPQAKKFEIRQTMTAEQRRDLAFAIGKCKSDAIDYEESIKTFGETFQHLKSTFPNIKMPPILSVIVAKPQGESARGIVPTSMLEAVDDETNESRFVLIGAMSDIKNDTTYNHGDFRNTSDYIRHEIGHAIAIANGIDDEVFSKWGKETLGEKSFAEKMQSVSDYAVADRPQGEAIAECFSLYTSKDYDGRLGAEIEGFIKERMTGEKA